MSLEDNKALARRAIEEIMNQRNLADFEELHAPDYVCHILSRTIQGPEPVKQILSMVLTAFPDLHYTFEDVFGEGDRVVVRYTSRGTHKGDLMGIAPTGKQVTITGTSIMRIANGKILEEWINSDLMQQLGVTSTPGQAR
jgi:steroid delta-isomerase-like uncharacterized protein